MIQTQFAHTVNVPDEWEHDGHTFQVMQDIDAECPTEWYDTVEMITLDTYSRTTIPTYAPSDGAEWDVLDIMRNQFSHDSDLTTEAWENAAEAALNNKYGDVRLLGKTLKVSDIAKELCPEEWETYVDEGINMHRLLKLVRPII